MKTITQYVGYTTSQYILKPLMELDKFFNEYFSDNYLIENDNYFEYNCDINKIFQQNIEHIPHPIVAKYLTECDNWNPKNQHPKNIKYLRKNYMETINDYDPKYNIACGLYYNMAPWIVKMFRTIDKEYCGIFKNNEIGHFKDYLKNEKNLKFYDYDWDYKIIIKQIKNDIENDNIKNYGIKHYFLKNPNKIVIDFIKKNFNQLKKDYLYNILQNPSIFIPNYQKSKPYWKILENKIYKLF